MKYEHAKPGDTVEVTCEGFLGQQYVVIECPESHKFNDEPGRAWHLGPMGHPLFFAPEHYKIIKRANRLSSVVNDDVEKSLRKQTNDNLKGVFG